MDKPVIGIEWNPQFPDLRLIDEWGKPLALSHAELCKHPSWKAIYKADNGIHIPTIYCKSTGRDFDSGIWRVWISDHPKPGFVQVSSFIVTQDMAPVTVLSLKAGKTLLSLAQYNILRYLFHIEKTVLGGESGPQP